MDDIQTEVSKYEAVFKKHSMLFDARYTDIKTVKE